MRIRVNKNAAAVTVAGAALAAMGATAAYAAIGPSADGTIYACFNNTTGAMRMLDPATTTCPSGETRTWWNQRGRTGATGYPGPQGIQGPKGPPGDSNKHWVKISAEGNLVATSHPHVNIYDVRRNGHDGYVYFPGTENRECAMTVTPTAPDSSRQIIGLRIPYTSAYWARFSTTEGGRVVAVPVDITLHC